MHVIGLIVAGLVVGVVARFFVPGRFPVGMAMTLLIGVSGAVYGEWMGHALGFYEQTERSGWISSIGSVLGASVLLALYLAASPRLAERRL